ncbi:helix-turn-helix domain-containing protein [Georgenia satyanarayanai]|uniref:helix-turn-helix domain-containing protein n=1 Tax=Georgenia satyanarayanai TaxID=860221 RepID=UPI00203C0120|nr:helix-turn-helix domain-containing protein [Georgenia satyanarayanai]MCM3659711.1 helix-turn-helix domain-containing protein [Georgenia satyanarayanai]
MSPLVPHTVPAPLRPLVATAVGYRAPAYPAGVHRGLPSRHLTLVVELLGPLTVRGLGETVSAHGVVGGLHTVPALIDASRPQEGVQYALGPLGARLLLGIPAGELRDRAVGLEDILGPDAARLVEQMAGTPHWPGRFRLLDEALLLRLAGSRWGTGWAAPAEVAEAWRLILASEGRLPVVDVAATVGWGRRHLGEQFRRATGLTPKEASRVTRFEHAQRRLRARRPLADVAVETGYADQAHLAREWRALTGASMTTWLREELPFVQDGARTPGARSVS